MSNEEKEKNAEAEEQEVLEQAQDAPRRGKRSGSFPGRGIA